MSELAELKGRKGGGKDGGSDDPNTLRSKSIGRILDLVSEGPILGLVGEKQGIYLNRTPWMANNGEMNFTGVQADMRYGLPAQDPVAGFPAIEREVSVGTQIKKLIPVTRQLSDPLLSAVRVTLSVSGLVHSTDNGGLEGTSVNHYIEMRSYGGSWVKVVDDTISGKTTGVYERSYRVALPSGGAPWDIRVTRTTDDSYDVKLQNDTYFSHYTEIIDNQLIYPDSAYFGVTFDASLFKDGLPQRNFLIDGIKMRVPSNYYPLGITLENLLTYSEDMSNAAYTKSAVTLATGAVDPSGNATAYGLVPTMANSMHTISRTLTGLTAGLLYNHSVHVKAGNLTNLKKLRFKVMEASYYAVIEFDTTTKAVSIQSQSINAGGTLGNYRVDDAGNGWYRLSIALLADPARTSTTHQIEGVVDTSNSYAGTGATVLAYVWGFQISRNRSVLHYLKTVAAAASSTSAQRYYDGTWDGTFKIEWTNNPAWVFFMLLTHVRFGLGQWMNDNQIDKWQLYNLAKYCDELVPNGFGGTEPRFTFNGVIKDRDDAYKVIQNIATAFRGIVYWGAGTTLVSYDHPKDASILVNSANVIDGRFDYQGVGWKARHSAALVKWQDPDALYQDNIEAVEDQDLIERFGWRPIETTAVGCTSRGQAYRWGKWILETEKYETETVTYRASFDHMIKDGTAVMPGDIVKLHDPSYAGVRAGGRIQKAYNIGDAFDLVDNSTLTHPTVVLDAPITMSATDSYTLSMVAPGGTLVERSVLNEVMAGTKDVTSLKLTGGALAIVPLQNSMWVLTSTSVAPRLFRVLYIKEVEANIVEVQALYYDPTKFARVEENIVLETPSFSVIKVGPLNPPRNLTTHEYLHKGPGGAILSTVTLSWEAPSNEARVNAYEVQMKQPNQDWAAYDTSYEQSIDIDNVRNAIYGFRVRAISAVGTPSNWLALDSVHLFGTSAKPDAVTGFNMNAIGDQAYLTWDVSQDFNVDYYTIKQQNVLTGAQWGSAIPLVTTIPRNLGHTMVPLLFGTYMIKPVSISGFESDDMALVISNITGISNFNAVMNINAGPTWAGVKTNCQINGATLETTAASGIYESDATYQLDGCYDLGAVYTNRLTQSIIAAGIRPSYMMDQWDHLSDVTALAGAVSTAWNIFVEYSTTQDDPASGTAVWTGWTQLVVGDSTARAYKFRVRMLTTDATIKNVLYALNIMIDMPDRTEGQQNLTVPTTGIMVSYANKFKEKPAVAVTIQNARQGDDAILTSETTAGFSILIKNGDAAVARTINWIAKGYGKS